MQKMKRSLAAASRAIPSVVCDLAGLSGGAAVSYGAWLIYQPAGFIVGGILLSAGAALFGARLNAP